MKHILQLKRLIVGDPLPNSQLSHERIPKWKALAVLSSDALSSVAYATEEVLIALCAFSALAAPFSMVISIFIAGLLLVVTLSYRQTIASYPSGGGAYIVAKENLGTTAGLVAGAALLIDYVLTVAVSVSAGVENMASAFHFLWPYRETLGIIIIIIIMLLNLRGIRESATVFALPTYFFIFSFLLLLAKGLWMVAFDPSTVVQEPSSLAGSLPPEIPIFIVLKAFASGCSALTGVEAISNGIPIFKNPSQTNAKVTLGWMSAILGFFFLGISYLAFEFGILPHANQTVVSLLAEHVFGHSIFFYLTQFSTALILVLAANTSYADFPRLASLLAKDKFLPRQLASLGDRLVFSNGIIGLSLCAIGLIVLYGGETHHLIPLYAVGVFLSFTLSQSGMVMHHFRLREQGWRLGLLINLIGALSTAVVLIVIAGTKFIHGAWIVVFLIPLFVSIFYRINRHYFLLGRQLGLKSNDKIKNGKTINHKVVIPVSGVHRGILMAINYAKSISHQVEALYVELDPSATGVMIEDWRDICGEIPLRVLTSPFRSINDPLLKYINDLLMDENFDFVTVIIPEFVTAHWWENFLHNHSALFIKTALRFKRRVVVTTVRYHLKR